MGKIQVIGAGSTDIRQISQEIFDELATGKKIFARTLKNEAILELSKRYEIFSFDSYYENGKNVEAVEKEIFLTLEKEAKKEDLIYLVPGSPFVLEKAVSLLIDKKLPLSFINNQAAADLVFSRLSYVTDGYRTLSAKDFNIHKADYSLDLLIQEIEDAYSLDELFLKLSDLYTADTSFSIIKDGGLATEEIYTDKIKNYSRKIVPNHQTSLLVYKPKEGIYAFADLLETTDILRGPEGCPWDIEQDHKSLRQDLLSEAYEAVNAINNNDLDNLCEELGDLLYLIAFHSQIAYENGDFSIRDVVNDINNKLIYRHPHVFSDLKLDKSTKVLQNWDSIKYSSRDIRKFWERLASNKGNPSTIRVYDIIDKVTRIGFNWNSKDEVLKKVIEEYDEVVEAAPKMTNGQKLEIKFKAYSGFPLYLSVTGVGPRNSSIKASIKAVSTDGLIEIPELKTEQFQNEEGPNMLRHPYCEYIILP